MSLHIGQISHVSVEQAVRPPKRQPAIVATASGSRAVVWNLGRASAVDGMSGHGVEYVLRGYIPQCDNRHGSVVGVEG